MTNVRRIAGLAGVAASVFVVVGLLSPTTAVAAPVSVGATAASPSLLQLSSDGVTYGQTLTVPVFDPSVRMIPQSSQHGDFWVRNASTGPAYLRLVVGGVTGSNSDLLGELSVIADTTSTTGQAVALTSALPCRVLTQGDLLQPGSSIRIDTALAVGDLAGSAGQGGRVNFEYQVGLSTIDPAGTPATTCITAATVVPVFPPATNHPNPVQSTAPRSTSSHASANHESGATGVAAPAATPTPGPTADPGPVPQFVLTLANTGRFFQEDFVMLWLVGAVLGAVLVLILARRRRHRADRDQIGVTP